MSTDTAEILRFLLHLGVFVVVFGPLVLLVELAHHRAVAEGRSTPSSSSGPEDADARRLAGELRAVDAVTPRRSVAPGRRHLRVSRGR